MYHAEQMASLDWGRIVVKKQGAVGGASLWEVTAEVRNTHLFPTRSGIQQQNRIGTVDLLTITPSSLNTTIAAAAKVDNWYDFFARPIDHEPARIQMPEGIPGRAGRIVRWFIEGPEGATLKLEYTSQRARKIERTIELKESDKR
jgi:hypothetical protein